MTQLEIEVRDAKGRVEVTNYEKRQIELVVIPYEREAQVVHRGRQIREIVARGAFEKLNAKDRLIMVNRGHNVDQVVGKAIRFQPSNEEGLVAELEIERTVLGDDTLELADKGYLKASAGFGVPDGGESWPQRGLRRLTRLWLDHIAMTPVPVYPGTDVIAVRDRNEPIIVTAFPNREKIKGWRLADRYALIE